MKERLSNIRLLYIMIYACLNPDAWFTNPFLWKGAQRNQRFKKPLFWYHISYQLFTMVDMLRESLWGPVLSTYPCTCTARKLWNVCIAKFQVIVLHLHWHTWLMILNYGRWKQMRHLLNIHYIYLWLNNMPMFGLKLFHVSKIALVSVFYVSTHVMATLVRLIAY